MNNREAFEVIRRDKLEELLDEYFDLAVEKGRNFERNGLRSNQVRKEILSLFDLASQAQQPKIRHELKHDWIEDMRLGKTGRNTCACCGVMFVGDSQKALCKPCHTSSESETIVKLINTIQYMVGIAERGLGEECNDDQMPERFLLDYVKSLEAQAQQTESQKPVAWVSKADLATLHEGHCVNVIPHNDDCVFDQSLRNVALYALPPAPEGDKP